MLRRALGAMWHEEISAEMNDATNQKALARVRRVVGQLEGSSCNSRPRRRRLAKRERSSCAPTSRDA